MSGVQARRLVASMQIPRAGTSNLTLKQQVPTQGSVC